MNASSVNVLPRMGEVAAQSLLIGLVGFALLGLFLFVMSRLEPGR